MGRIATIRDRVKANPATRSAYRVIVGLIGFAVAAMGVALLALPGPGLLVLFVGLTILASEFPWARRIERFARQEATRWFRWAARQSLWLRMTLAAGSSLALLAVVYLSVRLTGVPDWVPDRLAELVED